MQDFLCSYYENAFLEDTSDVKAALLSIPNKDLADKILESLSKNRTTNFQTWVKENEGKEPYCYATQNGLKLFYFVGYQEFVEKTKTGSLWINAGEYPYASENFRAGCPSSIAAREFFDNYNCDAQSCAECWAKHGKKLKPLFLKQ